MVFNLIDEMRWLNVNIFPLTALYRLIVKTEQWSKSVLWKQLKVLGLTASDHNEYILLHENVFLQSYWFLRKEFWFLIQK